MPGLQIPGCNWRSPVSNWRSVCTEIRLVGPAIAPTWLEIRPGFAADPPTQGFGVLDPTWSAQGALVNSERRTSLSLSRLNLATSPWNFLFIAARSPTLYLRALFFLILYDHRFSSCTFNICFFPSALISSLSSSNRRGASFSIDSFTRGSSFLFIEPPSAVRMFSS